MTGQGAADEFGLEAREHAHDAERYQSHVLEVIRSPLAFMEPGEGLDLVAYLGIARQISWFYPALTDAPRRFLLGPVILRFVAKVHRPRGFETDLPPQFVRFHPERLSPRWRKWASNSMTETCC
jgi:hypothetical protein